MSVTVAEITQLSSCRPPFAYPNVSKTMNSLYSQLTIAIRLRDWPPTRRLAVSSKPQPLV